MHNNDEALNIYNDENLTQIKNIKSKNLKIKKRSTTIHLTEEAENAFLELYIYRLRKDKKADKSTIACQAILELYEKECEKIKAGHIL